MSVHVLPAALLLLLAIPLLGQEPKSAPKIEGKSKNEEVEKAAALFQKGKIDESFLQLKEAVKITPSLPPARLMLTRFFLSSNQPQLARAQLELAFNENPDHPEIYLTNASIALSEGRLADTILNCRTALDLSAAERWSSERKSTFRREARAGLATAFESRQDWASARKELTFWLEFEPKNGVMRQRLARSFVFRACRANSGAALTSRNQERRAHRSAPPRSR